MVIYHEGEGVGVGIDEAGGMKEGSVCLEQSGLAGTFLNLRTPLAVGYTLTVDTVTYTMSNTHSECNNLTQSVSEATLFDNLQ